jgi:hypothetical protein
MATLGIEITDLKPGAVELRMPYAAAYTQQQWLHPRRHHHDSAR